MIILEMAQPSAPNSLRRFYLLTRFARTETLPVRERELRRHIGDYALFRPEHGTPDLPFFRRLVTEW